MKTNKLLNKLLAFLPYLTAALAVGLAGTLLTGGDLLRAGSRRLVIILIVFLVVESLLLSLYRDKADMPGGGRPRSLGRRAAQLLAAPRAARELMWMEL